MSAKPIFSRIYLLTFMTSFIRRPPSKFVLHSSNVQRGRPVLLLSACLWYEMTPAQELRQRSHQQDTVLGSASPALTVAATP
eukprot:3666003-Pleurochrysis_carterae.AAC.1